MKRFSLAAVFLALSSTFAFAFSEKDIVSPYGGSWNNMQPLVIDLSDGSELYYSISGSDPFESGFAYDGPVLIEKKGDVCVRIGCIERSGLKKEFRIDYTVTDPEFGLLDGHGKSFAERILKTPLVSYVSGSEISVPEGFIYSFENGRFPYLKEKISLNKENTYERYIPFVVTDGVNTYHSVIHVMPAEQNKVAKMKFPFEISQWNDFYFTDRNYIYQLDDEMWNSNYEPRKIDRKVDHYVRFQPMDYKKGNGIYEVKIPAKPSISKIRKMDGSCEIKIKSSDNYTFANGKKTLCLQVFNGEEMEFTYEPEIFYEGNVHGSVKIPVVLDKLPPSVPEIISSSNGSLSRSSVSLNITGEKDCGIYYAVSDPVFFEDEFDDFELLENSASLKFRKYSGNEITIKTAPEVAAVYVVYAYAIDKSGNKSRTVSRKFVLDELNYYVASGSVEGKHGDGSFLNPFTSLSEAFDVINSAKKESRLHVSGKLFVDNKILRLVKDCRIYGRDCSIIFAGDSCLEVEGCRLTLENCSMEKRPGNEDSLSPIFKIENASVIMKNCEVSGSNVQNGSLVHAKNSDLKIEDSGFTVLSGLYSLCFDVENTKALFNGCRFTSTAETATNVKVTGRKCAFVECNFTSIGNICRGVELFDAEAFFSSSSFSAVSERKSKSSAAVYKNAGSELKRFLNITTTGY